MSPDAEYRVRRDGNFEPVEMRVVDTGEVDRLAPALDPRPFVQQHPVAHGLHAGDHADAVVVAQYRIGGALDLAEQLSETGQRRVEGPKVRAR